MQNTQETVLRFTITPSIPLEDYRALLEAIEYVLAEDFGYEVHGHGTSMMDMDVQNEGDISFTWKPQHTIIRAKLEPTGAIESFTPFLSDTLTEQQQRDIVLRKVHDHQYKVMNYSKKITRIEITLDQDEIRK